MIVIEAAQTPRRHETANAVMHTYASASLTGTELAVWRVEMPPAAAGPIHSVDVEQVLVMLQGEVALEVDGITIMLGADASAVIPAGASRRVTNDAATSAVAIMCCRSGARASRPEQPDVTIPWAA
jgi:quercetin dioxygenase-like cupin family protein